MCAQWVVAGRSSNSATIPTHIDTGEIRTFMSTVAVEDLYSSDMSPPVPVDNRGRSPQTFLVEVVVSSGRSTRRAVARGQDIYAVTAPLVAAATQHILDTPTIRPGVVTAGKLVDAHDFLASIGPEHLTLENGPFAGRTAAPGAPASGQSRG